jgi:hypothetical protein
LGGIGSLPRRKRTSSRSPATSQPTSIALRSREPARETLDLTRLTDQLPALLLEVVGQIQERIDSSRTLAALRLIRRGAATLTRSRLGSIQRGDPTRTRARLCSIHEGAGTRTRAPLRSIRRATATRTLAPRLPATILHDLIRGFQGREKSVTFDATHRYPEVVLRLRGARSAPKVVRSGRSAAGSHAQRRGTTQSSTLTHPQAIPARMARFICSARSMSSSSSRSLSRASASHRSLRGVSVPNP